METLTEQWENMYHMELGEPEEYAKEEPDEMIIYDGGGEDE